MAELNKIRFLLFVSLMIFPARALDVIFSAAHQDFKQKSEIIIDIMDGEKIYRGTWNQLTYEAELGISKVIVYIISRSRCIEILRPAGVAREIRSQIAQELREMHCELVFLGIENFDDDEYHLIGAFLLEKIQPHSNQPSQPEFNIETIGENRFDHFYGYHVINFEKHQQNAQYLLTRLRSIPHGALRPIECNDKEIKLFGYYPAVKEVTWSVCVENNTYIPSASDGDPKYNFMIKYRKKKICLLILSGKEYTAVTSFGNRCAQRRATSGFRNGMKDQEEVLVVLGVFNFDWTEVDIVAQIIRRYSVGSELSIYNVFTCGYGMFDTYYSYVYEGGQRYIQQQPNSHVSELIKVLIGKEVKKKAIDVYYYYNNEWDVWNTSINLDNGRYVPEVGFNNFTIPCMHQKIAFIVYDRAEMYNPIDYLAMGQSVAELERSGISVVLIEAANFELDDMHIIAEWVDRHSAVINLEQIAVLGGGIFDTIFQSEFTTYNKFLDTRKNELDAIRNAFVKSGNGKSVSAAKLDDYLTFEVWSYPMNTVVNGCYEPDLIPDKNVFNTTGESRIYFIITSAYNFQQISAMENVAAVATSFRQDIFRHYPTRKWRVFIVGLYNFEERDSHLFAELIKRQTNDGRPFGEFIRTFTHSTSPAIYQYKDTTPFDVDGPDSHIPARFAYYF